MSNARKTAQTAEDVAQTPEQAETKKVDLSEQEKSVPQAPEQTDTKQEDLAEELDEDEKEFRAIRRDLPGMKGSSAAGIVAISVGKTPRKNAFFRTHREFRPIVPLVDHEVGMERQYFAVTADMVEPLNSIGIKVANCTLYLTVTSGGALRIIPVRLAPEEGEQNEYDRTREIGLLRAMNEWVRLFSDTKNQNYRVYPAPEGRFGEPQFTELKEARIFKLGFRDKGHLLDSTEHQLFKKWAARDSD